MTPEAHARKLQRTKEWRARNEEHIRAYSHAYKKKWRKEHREEKNAKAREYYRDNIEKEHERSRRKVKRNAEKRLATFIAEHGCTPEEYKAQQKIGKAEERRERHRLISLRYQHTHREEINARNRARRRDEPEKIHHYSRTSKARRRGAPGSFTLEEWHELCDRFDDRCVRCGEKKELGVDHVIPVCKPGSTNNISNIQPLCGTCNKFKKIKSTDYRPLWGNKITWCNLED